MINSIQSFQEKGIKNLEKIFREYSGDFSRMAEMVYGVTEEVTKLGCSLIAEEWESYDELLRERKSLRKGWHIVKRDTSTLTTSLGDVTYRKTLFRHVKTGAYSYLLDQLLQIEPHTRLTEDAVARILEEAVDTTYKKGGINASISGSVVSKETVMNKLHVLNFPSLSYPDELRCVPTLYIDADEDHVSLQFFEKKGDIEKPRNNTVMPRIAYVYEGIDTEEDGRPKLINPKYFGGVYDGTDGVKAFWKEIDNYIQNTYDTEELQCIYINGDGANWIKTGVSVIPNSKFVLDRFHMHKYITTATAHLGDSTDDARSEIYRCIYKNRKKACRQVFDQIVAVTESETKANAVETSKGYILSNWAGIQISLKKEDENIRCSAEGHVSHIFADRMSSRPLGWSRVGCDKMARLRVYKKNAGDMLALVRFQKEKTLMAAGAEDVICSAYQIIKSERAYGREAHVSIVSENIPDSKIRRLNSLINRQWHLS